MPVQVECICGSPSAKHTSMLQTSAGAAYPTVVTVSQTWADYTVATFSASVQQDVSNLANLGVAASTKGSGAAAIAFK